MGSGHAITIKPRQVDMLWFTPGLIVSACIFPAMYNINKRVCPSITLTVIGLTFIWYELNVNYKVYKQQSRLNPKTKSPDNPVQ
jgi:hypothetical protein